MATWDTNYEAQPQDLSNPGFGAAQIRGDKVAVRERGEKEHAWGANELTEAQAGGGTHLEGSGRVWVSQDDGSSGDDDDARDTRGSRIDPATIVSTPINDLVGRVNIDLNEIDPLPETNESAISSSNNLARVRTIKCYDAEGDLITVFDPDTFVSAALDQISSAAITGLKEFVHSLRVQDTAWHTDAEYDALSAGEKTEADKELLPRAEIVRREEEAVEQGYYDPKDHESGGDAPGDGNFTAYAWGDMPAGFDTSWTQDSTATPSRCTKDITCGKFAAQEVWAEAIHGAVWG